MRTEALIKWMAQKVQRGLELLFGLSDTPVMTKIPNDWPPGLPKPPGNYPD